MSQIPNDFRQPQAIEGVFPLINAAISDHNKRITWHNQQCDITSNPSIIDFHVVYNQIYYKNLRKFYRIYIAMRLLIARKELRSLMNIRIIRDKHGGLAHVYFRRIMEEQLECDIFKCSDLSEYHTIMNCICWDITDEMMGY